MEAEGEEATPRRILTGGQISSARNHGGLLLLLGGGYLVPNPIASAAGVIPARPRPRRCPSALPSPLPRRCSSALSSRLPRRCPSVQPSRLPCWCPLSALTRVPNYKELALECASTEYGCALLQEAEDMDDPLDDVLKSLQNEESLTCAANKDDAENTKTSHSDVEDSAAPSRKGHSEEVLT